MGFGGYGENFRDLVGRPLQGPIHSGNRAQIMLVSQPTTISALNVMGSQIEVSKASCSAVRVQALCTYSLFEQLTDGFERQMKRWENI
jgi:hypothetical protein